MRRFTTMVISLLLLTAATACGDDDEPVVAGDEGNGNAPADDEPGGGDDALFVSVERGGGFVPVGHDFRSLPSAVIYEDGRTFSPGAVMEIYPGPAVHPVFDGEISDERMRDVVGAAEDAGLLDETPPDFGETLIADAGTTTITVVVGGETHVTSVYALTEGGDTLPGMEPEHDEARGRVSDFVGLVTSTVAEGDEYVPDRYRLLPLPPEEIPAGGVEPDERDWPFADVTLTERECLAVTDGRADTLRDALQDATEITRWRTEAATVVLVVRPLLPHEPDCPDAG
ncbi:MAG: hypothetical protein ACSLFO_02850 [Acidimicrobiales bacterium]